MGFVIGTPAAGGIKPGYLKPTKPPSYTYKQYSKHYSTYKNDFHLISFDGLIGCPRFFILLRNVKNSWDFLGFFVMSGLKRFITVW